MKIIGVEFRVGYHPGRTLEVKLVPIEIPVPAANLNFRLYADLTVHTNVGDVTCNPFELPRDGLDYDGSSNGHQRDFNEANHLLSRVLHRGHL